METEFINVHLSVEVKNKSVLAHLTFQNKSEKSIYLNKQVMYYNGLVRNNYFEIEDSNGVRTSYLGYMANCTRMPDEYVLMGPGASINSIVPLHEFYKLLKGQSYKARYYAFNPSYQKQQGLMEMESNNVEISY